MYLSKVHIEGPAARNPYDWHRTLWRLFPGRPEDARDFLFRVEAQRPDTGALLLLQSTQAPVMNAQDVRLLAEPKSLDALRLESGQSLRFKLTANPSRKIRDRDDAERKLRVPLIREDEQLDWLARKLAPAAAIEAASARNNPPLYFRKGGQGGKIVTVTFEGMLSVTDAAALRALLHAGIGAAKSFGCGLLTLARG